MTNKKSNQPTGPSKANRPAGRPASPASIPKEDPCPPVAAGHHSAIVETLEFRILRELSSGKGLASITTLNQKGNRDSALSRARDLPTMFLRHGPSQVLVFLEAKGGTDKEIADLLVYVNQGLQNFAGAPSTDNRPYKRERLTPQTLKIYFETEKPEDLGRRIVDQRTFAEISRWLARILEAMEAGHGA